MQSVGAHASARPHVRERIRSGPGTCPGAEVEAADTNREENPVEDDEGDPRDGGPHGELLGLGRGGLSTGDVPKGPLAVDLCGEHDRGNAQRQAAQEGGQDRPDQVVGRRRALGSWGAIRGRWWWWWRRRGVAVVRHAQALSSWVPAPDGAA